MNQARCTRRASCTRPIKRLATLVVTLAGICFLAEARAQACVDDDGDGWGWNGNSSCLVSQPTGTTACVDPDGDGYGWNGSTSCLVDGTSTNNAICEDLDGDGFGWNGVASCLVGAPVETPDIVDSPSQANCVDDDGDGWGWNGSSSCLVSAGSNSGANNATCVDDDADGWGWNGSSSCLTNPAAVSSPAAITDLVLLTGQSNALGAGTSYDPSLDSGHRQVYAFTNSGWMVADLHQVWDLDWHPRTQPGTEPDNNLALHFGKRLVQRDSSRVVGFILATAPGQPIAHWAYNGEFYNSIRARVNNAINQLPHKSQLDGILYHQGESDGADTVTYGNALRGLINNFRSEPWFDYNKPFICGETSRLPVNNQLNSLNRDTDPFTSCVPATDLPTHLDQQHFTAEALRTLGARYADRYLEVVQ